MLWEGYWWTTLDEDVARFVNECNICKAIKPMNNVTLFRSRKTPKWASNIIKYLESPKWVESMPQHRQKGLETECKNYEIIGGQL